VQKSVLLPLWLRCVLAKTKKLDIKNPVNKATDTRKLDKMCSYLWTSRARCGVILGLKVMHTLALHVPFMWVYNMGASGGAAGGATINPITAVAPASNRSGSGRSRVFT
jgi:hypothetical protein